MLGSAIGLLAAVLTLVAPPAADQAGLVDPATGAWHLPDGGGVVSFYFGVPGDLPFMGDWDCDGIDTPGLYRRSTGLVYLHNTNATGPADLSYHLGVDGDLPVAGDFDGDGCDSVSVYRPSEGRVFIADRTGPAGAWVGAGSGFYYGVPGDVPIAGDWDGDGVDTIGLRRPSTGFVYLRNTNSFGPGDVEFFFGANGDVPVAGDWDGDGTTTVAVFRPSQQLYYFAADNRTAGAGRIEPLCVGTGLPVAGSTGSVPIGGPTGSVDLALDARELLPLGDGVTITAVWQGGSAVLDGSQPVSVDIPAGGVDILFHYTSAGGFGTNACWRQRITPSTTPVTVVQPWRGRTPAPPAGVMLGWQANGDTERYIAELGTAPALTVTSPMWWYPRNDGTINDMSDPALVAAAHARGLQVWPAVASFDANRNHYLLADEGRRRALAVEIDRRARALGVDGVNIDIEGYRDEDGEAVAAFVEDLADLVHAWGGVVSFDTTNYAETWHLSPGDVHWVSAAPRRALSEAVDYLMVMSYTQHNRSQPYGPVADPPWVEEGIRYQLRYTDAERLVIGVPFWEYVWNPAVPASRPAVADMDTYVELVASGVRSTDPAFAVDRIDLPDGRFLYDTLPAALANARRLVSEYGLAGMAAWRLGFDSAETWRLLTG